MTGGRFVPELTGELVVSVAGRDVFARVRGAGDRLPVVLVHGGAAHHGWWDEVAVHLASGRRVAALDLSGHGVSSHHETYGWDQWADEVHAVAEEISSGGPFAVVGHSMGGLVGLRVAARCGDRVRGLVVVDSAIRDRPDEELEPFLRRAAEGPRFYATREEALARFTVADQAPFAERHVIERLADLALLETTAGHRWRFDPGTFRDGVMSPEEVRPISSPLVLVAGEFGHMPAEVCATIETRAGRPAERFPIPGAGHHVMIERPFELAECLEGVLLSWERG